MNNKDDLPRQMNLHKAWRALLAIVVTACACASSMALDVDNLVVSNTLTQTSSSATNTFDGHVVVEGGLTVESALRVPRQGDVEMGSFTNGSPFGGTSGAADGSSASFAVTPSYIYGCWADYSNTTSVVISAGEGFCNGSYFHLTNEVTVTVSGVSEPMVYFYIDDSASTYPKGVQFTFTTNAPSFDTQRMGWYLGDDRVVSGALVDSAGDLRSFDRGSNGECMFRSWAWSNMRILSGGNPNNAWQATSTPLASVTPANACLGFLWIGGSHPWDNDVQIKVAGSEYADNTTAFLSGFHSAGVTAGSVAVRLGPSRNIKWTGQDDDANTASVYVLGWLTKR